MPLIYMEARGISAFTLKLRGCARVAAMNAELDAELERKTYESAHGVVRYLVSRNADEGRPWLVFLHGMLVDHRLFTPQLEHFAGQYNLLAWDAPAHNESRPYDLEAVSVLGVAAELAAIFDGEGIESPILIGQSFGGIVAQGLMQLRPSLANGFVCISSMPIRREFWPAIALFALPRTGPLLRLRSFKRVLKNAPKETSCTPHGQAATREMLREYSRDEYFNLAERTFVAIAEAVALDLPYRITCPTLLIVGEHDTTGGTKRFNRRWAETDDLPLAWVPDAAHNSNVDNPEAVNRLISNFVTGV